MKMTTLQVPTELLPALLAWLDHQVECLQDAEMADMVSQLADAVSDAIDG